MYLAVSCIWVMAITGMYIRKFTIEFPLEVQASHPDQCGGLKFLGSFLLKAALLLLLTTLF